MLTQCQTGTPKQQFSDMTLAVQTAEDMKKNKTTVVDELRYLARANAGDE